MTLTITDDDKLKGNLTKRVKVVLANVPPLETEIHGSVLSNVETIYKYKFCAVFPEDITIFLLFD